MGLKHVFARETYLDLRQVRHSHHIAIKITKQKLEGREEL